MENKFSKILDNFPLEFSDKDKECFDVFII
jgi:hypothetical protein